jgi:hypothetical protein
MPAVSSLAPRAEIDAEKTKTATSDNKHCIHFLLLISYLLRLAGKIHRFAGFCNQTDKITVVIPCPSNRDHNIRFSSDNYQDFCIFQCFNSTKLIKHSLTSFSADGAQ